MPSDIIPPRLLSKGYLSGYGIELIRGGQSYFERLISLIEGSSNTIHLQVYILANDSTGQAVANALQRAAQRGVKVYLMVDGYASQSLPDSFIHQLEQAGVRFRFFEPLFKSQTYYFGRRMHQKVIVVDAATAMVGGINIANRYNDTEEGAAWLDFALLVHGPVAKEICRRCARDWRGYVRTEVPAPCIPVNNNVKVYTNNLIPVKICRNDFVKGKNQISAVYVELLRTAQKKVIILSSYFLPGSIIRRHLIQAVKRGVEVIVITAGDSDVKVAKNAERWLYDYLLRNGVKLFEYQNNILHGKIAVCDGEWMTAGSYNINNISAYASTELNLAVRDQTFSRQTEELLGKIIQTDCIPITAETHSRSGNLFIQFVRWCSYQFIRLMIYLFTFYFRQKP